MITCTYILCVISVRCSYRMILMEDTINQTLLVRFIVLRLGKKAKGTKGSLAMPE